MAVVRCPTEPISGSSKTDPLMAKVEHISNRGRPVQITYLRREKNHCTTSAGREE